jgi:hypothetical protein
VDRAAGLLNCSETEKQSWSVGLPDYQSKSDRQARVLGHSGRPTQNEPNGKQAQTSQL